VSWTISDLFLGVLVLLMELEVGIKLNVLTGERKGDSLRGGFHWREKLRTRIQEVKEAGHSASSEFDCCRKARGKLGLKPPDLETEMEEVAMDILCNKRRAASQEDPRVPPPSSSKASSYNRILIQRNEKCGFSRRPPVEHCHPGSLDALPLKLYPSHQLCAL
jgi:hypothetical protein